MVAEVLIVIEEGYDAGAVETRDISDTPEGVALADAVALLRRRGMADAEIGDELAWMHEGVNYAVLAGPVLRVALLFADAD